ncbi:Protein CBG07001 [Caenorhabditis briggsae]|nr:Protein CBG07001 [Caenorhabditis briggsae]UMM20912.1 hypothetical protein L5515_015993 [Caenorhabditis briggsae]CAP27343.2 Protein CBG07001 [Caenorhabditis briggsae]
MTDEENDDELIDMLNEAPDACPPNFFERDPTKDSTTVRTMHFALRSIVGQLRSPINTEAEAVINWLVYKQGGPHRHQKFFGFFRQMNRLVRKYNDMTLIKKLNPVLRKAENCGDDLYKLEEAAIRYMGCSYLKKLYLLERISESCLKCADGVVGLLELEHWINLSLVIFALCSQVHSEVITQMLAMEKVFKMTSKVFRDVDSRFPESLENLKVVEKVKRQSRVFEERNNEKTDLSAISRLLKFSSEKIKEAQTENDWRMKVTKVLNEELTAEITTTTAIATPKATKVSAQLDMSDLGISISRDDASFLNSTIQSTSTSVLFQSDEDDDSFLMSPNLFVPKSLKKKTKKRKSENPSAKSFLSSTLDLFSGDKKKKKKIK